MSTLRRKIVGYFAFAVEGHGFFLVNWVSVFRSCWGEWKILACMYVIETRRDS